MTKHVVIREIPEKKWTITADSLGICHVNGHMASRPIPQNDPNAPAYIVMPKAMGLDRRIKLLLTPEQLAAVKAHFARRNDHLKTPTEESNTSC